MQKIQHISGYLIGLFHTIIVALPLLLIFQWLYVDGQSGLIPDVLRSFGILDRIVTTPEGAVNLGHLTWTASLKLLGFCADAIDLLPFFISLFLLQRLFTHYKNKNVFSVQNARLFRKLGFLFMLDALLTKPLAQTLLVYVATANNAPGHRFITLSFGSPNLSSLYYGVLVMLVSWVMVEASKISSEQELTI